MPSFSHVLPLEHPDAQPALPGDPPRASASAVGVTTVGRLVDQIAGKAGGLGEELGQADPSRAARCPAASGTRTVTAATTRSPFRFSLYRSNR